MPGGSCPLGLSLPSAKPYVPGVVAVSQQPLSFSSSYRACVAGFTNITFNPHNDGLIDGPESYVSFSHYSDAVFLPQDPGRERTAVLLTFQWVFASGVHRKPGFVSSINSHSHVAPGSRSWPPGRAGLSS